MKEPTPIEKIAAEMLEAGMTPIEAARAIRKAMIAPLLRKHNGNICRTARELRMHRNTLARSMEQLKIADLPRQIRDEVLEQRGLNFSRAREGVRRRPEDRQLPWTWRSTSRVA